MAKDTDISLRNMTIYEVYVRNHSEKGDFNSVTNDLERIKSLGVDIVWLMPIHPIGKVNRKGSLGSPYSIYDYMQINEDYGTLDDFTDLLNRAHQLNLKVMIDVVYNHTSHDSIYLTQNPDFYFRKSDGSLGNKVADWSDIIDLDYANRTLWDKQIDALKYWASLGVDGFRCDVASMVPLEFWLKAREELKKINPDIIMLAETIEGSFLEYVRNQGIYAASDCEMYQAFDICYDYDTHGEFLKYLNGEATLEDYLEKKRIQEYIFPENYVKLRYLENHDRPRIASMVPEDLLLQWSAFLFFEKGTALIYAGQEAKDKKLPSLFDKDPVDWSGLSSDFHLKLKKFAEIKKSPIFANGRYKLHDIDKKGVILGTYVLNGEWAFGIFNVEGKTGKLKLSSHSEGYFDIPEIANGEYENLYDGSNITVENQSIDLNHKPILFKVSV